MLWGPIAWLFNIWPSDALSTIFSSEYPYTQSFLWPWDPQSGPLHLQSHMLSSPTFLHHKFLSLAALGQAGWPQELLVFMIKISTFGNWRMVLALVSLSLHQWEASPMLSAGLKDWGWRHRTLRHSQIIWTDRWTADRNPKVFYLLEKKRLSS